MDVACPKCKSEYEFDDARVPEGGVTVKCTSCAYVFRLKKEAPLEAHLPPASPTREWKLRKPSGNIVKCRDLTMLQRLIIEGKVQREDEISLTGENWKSLGSIPELASFFQIVDEAAKARAPAESAAVSTAPGRDVTDTLMGGRFAALAPDKVIRPPNVTDTLLGGHFSDGELSQTQGTRKPKFSPPPAEPESETLKEPVPSSVPPLFLEMSDEAMRTAVERRSSSGLGLLAVLVVAAVVALGGYFGVYEPEQKRAALEREAEQARTDAAARAAQHVALPPPVIETVDAGQAEEPDASFPIAEAPAEEEAPKDFDWHLAQGDRLRERDRPKQALTHYAAAEEFQPDRVEPVTGRGLALIDLGRPSVAAAIFERALTLNSRYGPAIMGAAEAYRLSGKNDKAIEYYERYLEVLPQGPEAAVARNTLERLNK